MQLLHVLFHDFHSVFTELITTTCHYLAWATTKSFMLGWLHLDICNRMFEIASQPTCFFIKFRGKKKVVTVFFMLHRNSHKASEIEKVILFFLFYFKINALIPSDFSWFLVECSWNRKVKQFHVLRRGHLKRRYTTQSPRNTICVSIYTVSSVTVHILNVSSQLLLSNQSLAKSKKEVSLYYNFNR